MSKNFMFHKEYYDGSYFLQVNLSKTKAERLYKQTLNAWDLELKGCGWEEMQEPLTPSQEIKFKKASRSKVYL